MIYFKINEKINELVQLVPDVKNKKIFLGCKPFCKSQIIALDELELMRKLLKEANIKDITIDELREIKSSTKSAYYLNHHVCIFSKDNEEKYSKEELEK